MKNQSLIVAGFGLVLSTSSIIAQEATTETEIVRDDVLLIEHVEDTDHVNTPAHGATMTQVRTQFGEPAQSLSAVGEPPITRWVYDGFTVYFEHDKVIHAVVDRKVAQN